MAVREWGDEVIFPAPCDRASRRREVTESKWRAWRDCPDSIHHRAREILANLEQGELDEAG